MGRIKIESSNLWAWFLAALAVAIAVVQTACGDGGGAGGGAGAGGGGGGSAGGSSSAAVSGTASAGPLNGATITAYALNSDGSVGAQLATATTDADGGFSLSLSPQSSPVLVAASGGTYAEEAAGTTVNMAHAQLRVILPAVSAGQSIGITAVTEIAAEALLASVSSNGSTPLSSLIASTNASIAAAMGLADITIAPANPNVSAGTASSKQAAKYALVLASLSQLANGASTAGNTITSLDLAQGLATCFTYNGSFAGGAVALTGIPVTSTGSSFTLNAVFGGAGFSTAMTDAMNAYSTGAGAANGYDNASLVPPPTFVAAPAVPSGLPAVTTPAVPGSLPSTSPLVAGPPSPSPTPSQPFVGSATKITSVWGGAREAIALTSDGKVWTWGNNIDGELGMGNTSVGQALPQSVPGLDNVVAIMGAEVFNIALKSDGTVWTWGANLTSGPTAILLGAGPAYDADTTVSSPVQVSGLTSVVKLGSRAYHGVAVKSDGTVWTWGRNQDFSLGMNNTDVTDVPNQVMGVMNPIMVTAGFNFSYALLQNGTLVSWGSNVYESLGNATQYNNGVPLDSYTPVPVTGLTNVTDVSAGWEQGLALRSDGTVWAWGSNTWAGACGAGVSNTAGPANGILGIVDGQGNPVADEPVPTQIPGLTNVIQVSGGDSFSAVLKADGTVWTFGGNGCGQLGIGDSSITQSPTPVQVAGLTNVVWIAARDHHAQALKADGTLWSWGSGEQGELGVPCNPISVGSTPGPGDCVNSYVPVQVQWP